jgi:Brp/Blh family beta-carotene 15,15'-monooxygenase
VSAAQGPTPAPTKPVERADPQPAPLHPVHAAAMASTALAAAAVTAGLVAPGAVAAAAPALLGAGFLLGLPHGAVDHLVPAWTGLSRGGVRPMLAVLTGYAVIAVLAWVVLTFTGPAAVLVLLAVSAVHFGLGDMMAGPGARLRAIDTAAVLARGGPVIVLPLVLWPNVTNPVLAAFSPAVPRLLTPAIRTGLLVALLACAVVAVLDALCRRCPRDAVEVLLLLALFAALPPFAAFGLYFAGWHALRHTARLIVADPRNRDDLATGSWRSPLLRFARSAALPTAVVLATVIALIALARQPALFTPVLSVLLALTVPHVVIVAALDHAALTAAP